MRLQMKAVAALLATVLPATALPASGQEPRTPDFLFGPPSAQLSVRGSYTTALGRSDIFDFVREQHTLTKRDFNGFGGEVEAASRLGPGEIVFGAGYAASRARSSFRDWVDEDDQEIEQTLHFDRAPMTIGYRHYVTERGKTIGSFAWVPNRYAVYAGGALGMAWYRFVQTGDFIDAETLEVFPHTFQSSGMAPLGSVNAGIDYTVAPRVALNTQARFIWSRGIMGDDYIGFDRIDLSGFSLSAGIHFRF